MWSSKARHSLCGATWLGFGLCVWDFVVWLIVNEGARQTAYRAHGSDADEGPQHPDAAVHKSQNEAVEEIARIAG